MRYVGSVCGFTCPAGYLLKGPKSLKCLPSHNWSTEQVPDCKAQIEAPDWIVNNGMKFRPSWAELFTNTDENKVFLDVDKLDCETINRDVHEFMEYLKSKNITFSTNDLGIFYTACHGPL